ncbi:multifunctional nucleoside diphosphate kinase/apyrimidinic endonuclease/3'-phosphodiesterase [Listeria floridensis FSL S10-1187]|uniref:Nucleoside diphosphate kinase n=1 Tax=Listeria floridensis FSL S10-1187 TaxID=1265817 RepID=A0ABN0RGH3_9LIST|nr:nucleoside-diphosphate kinase [Listeria floridensis]EUJ32928.1 multifunctional nucleoside diphosphate kinase/apyrimidinic endonuclease/3'-phosphodiesterase [Listeria floridensis FSL S10-1187]
MERTYVMVKPDGVARGLTGKIVTRFEEKGLNLVAAKLLQIDLALAEEHYKEHASKPFFKDLISFITSGPVFAMVLEGDDAISIARKMMGATNPLEAVPGTIRADFGMHTNHNIIHGSDSPAAAEREIGLFFKSDELLTSKRADADWL